MDERVDNVLCFADGALCGQLGAFLDGELNPVGQECFRWHVARCERCAVALEEAVRLELLVDLAFGGRGGAEQKKPPRLCRP